MLYRYNYFLVTAVATNILITSCSPLKPDHPQQYHSFKERRSPRDNQVVASGTLGAVNNDKKSAYTPYWGPESKQQDAASAVNNAGSTAKATASEIQGKANSAIQPASESNNSGSFFERLMKKFSVSLAEDQPIPTKVALNSNRRAPKQNNHGIPDNNRVIEEIGQGSAIGTSYYDTAEDLAQINAMPPGKVEIINLAQNTNIPPPNPSAPLVNIPEMPDDNALKQQAAKEQNKPELHQVPNTPKPLHQPPAMPEVPAIPSTPMTPVQPTMVAPSMPGTPASPTVTQPVISQPSVRADHQAEITEEKSVKPKPKAKPANRTNKKHHHKKPSNADHNVTAYTYPDSKANYEEAIIRDKSAELTTYHGHHIVSGKLQVGVKKNCIPRPKEIEANE